MIRSSAPVSGLSTACRSPVIGDSIDRLEEEGVIKMVGLCSVGLTRHRDTRVAAVVDGAGLGPGERSTVRG